MVRPWSIFCYTSFPLHHPLYCLGFVVPIHIGRGRPLGRFVRINRGESSLFQFGVERRNILLLDFRPVRGKLFKRISEFLVDGSGLRCGGGIGAIDDLVALSALLSLMTYTSVESSGLQYIFLIPAAGLAAVAIVAGCGLALLSLRRPVAWANLALAAVALLVAAPWTGSGLGDLPGSILATALLPLAPVVTVAVVRGLGSEDCSL